MKKAAIGLCGILLAFIMTGIADSATNSKEMAEQDLPVIAEDICGDGLLELTAGNHVLGFKNDGIYLAAGTNLLHTRFVGSNLTQPVSLRKDESRVQGNLLREVVYEDLWDGVSVEYKKTNSGIYKSTYYINPEETNKNPVDKIRLKYNMPVEIHSSGELIFSYSNGQLRESRPIAWQVINGERKYVEVSYIQLDENKIGFKVGSYDEGHELIIDPVMQWHTFLGGTGIDEGRSIAVDGSGNIYVAGFSRNSWGSPINPYNDQKEAFVAKLSSTGSLIWNTFLGSAYNDSAKGITLDASGNIYVTGASGATWGSPVRAHAGDGDVFVAKLNNDGQLQWNTFIGGDNYDYGSDIALDSSGNIYIFGGSSWSWGTPVRAYSGNNDALAAKLNSSGALQWHTFLGSSSDEEGYEIAVDGSGNSYVAGWSDATWGTPLRAYAAGKDGFAAKLDTNGALQWNSFLGGSVEDEARGIALDSTGNVYVSGTSWDSWGSPLRSFSNPSSSTPDAFMVQLNNSGALQWNTFLGGMGDDVGREIVSDGNGNMYLTGDSYLEWGSPENPFRNNADVSVVKLSSSGAVIWNTFMGGINDEFGRSISADGIGNVYITGWSESTWGDPVSGYTGGDDVLVAKLSPYEVSGTVTFGASGLSGVTITGLPTSTVTSGDGTYQDGVSSGWSGTAIPALTGYVFTPANRDYTNITSDQLDQDYTAAVATYQISGTVTVSGSGDGLSGVSINGLPASPVTGADGTYSDTVEHGWSGTAVPARTGYWFTPASIDYSNVSADQTGQDYVAALNTYTISGTVTHGGSGLSGVTISGLPGDPATFGDGTYSAAVDHGWSGTAVPVLTGYTFSPSNLDYTNVTADHTGQDYIAALAAFTISGTVTESGSGLTGVTISGLPASPVTSGDGTYSDATVTYGWSGTAVPALAGYVFTPANRSYSNVTADQTDQDYTADALLSISGTVTSSGTGLAGVVMNGLPAIPATNASGDYIDYVDDNWSGVVTPTAAGYAFTPENRSYINITTDYTDQDYTAEADSAVIGISGVVDDGTNPLAGIILNGLPGNPATNSSGYYIDTVDSGWSGTVFPAASGYAFIPASRNYTSVTADQADQDYTASSNPNRLGVSGHITEADGTMVAGVELTGLPNVPTTNPSGYYLGVVDAGWSGTVMPVLSGYSFEPETRSYSSIAADQTAQDYTAIAGYPNSPSNYQVIPEVLWAPAIGGGTWMTEVQITDVTGGSEVSVYFNSDTGDRRGPIDLFTGSGPDTSVKTANLLNTLGQLDTGFDYYEQVGAVEFTTQDADHKIQVIARTKNGNYSKTFSGLNHNNDNTAGGSRSMIIQNLVSDDSFRTAYGGFNPTDESITVEYELFDGNGDAIGTPFSKTFSGRQYRAIDLFTEAGIPYTFYSYSNAWLKITPVSGNGELMSYGATANNNTNDPAVHLASQMEDTGVYNSPSNYQVIPEVLWAQATGGGTWMTEVQITDVTGGSQVSVYYNTSTGDRRGPIALFTGSSAGVSAKTNNLLQTLELLDPGYSYYATAGSVEFATQDADHKIHVIARTANGDYSKTFQGLNLTDANTASADRTLMVQNLVNDDTYRTAFGAFNPTDDDVTVEFTLMDENGSTIGTSFSKTFTGREYQAFNPFTEAGVPYPGNSYDNTWIKAEVTSGSGQLMVYGATANNATNDPAVHRAVQH